MRAWPDASIHPNDQYNAKRTARNASTMARYHTIGRQARIDSAPYPPGDNCDLCGKPFGKGVPAYDHDHKTGRFRGWLHIGCNTALGKLGDDLEGIRKAVAYLEKCEPVGRILEVKPVS